MPPIARSQRFLQKAEAALVAAIEIYNKPDFRHREECFAILALNAWELLLKARLLSHSRRRHAPGWRTTRPLARALAADAQVVGRLCTSEGGGLTTCNRPASLALLLA